MAKKETSNFAISREELIRFMATATMESELEESGKRYTNDLLFAPSATEEERNFIQFSDYFGE